MPRRSKERGFTLFELLVVVVVIAVLSLIMIPNLLNSLHRGKQKRTMSDLRSIGLAIEAYSTDNSNYPIASDIATLKAALDPVYMRGMPVKDGWEHDFVVSVAAVEYTVGSQGKDGAGGLAACAAAPLCRYLDDAIIFANGSFLQYPDSMQE